MNDTYGRRLSIPKRWAQLNDSSEASSLRLGYVRIGREAATSGKRLAVPAQEKALAGLLRVVYVAASAQESFHCEAAISIILEKLDGSHAGVTFFDEREFDDTNPSR